MHGETGPPIKCAENQRWATANISHVLIIHFVITIMPKICSWEGIIRKHVTCERHRNKDVFEAGDFHNSIAFKMDISKSCDCDSSK